MEIHKKNKDNKFERFEKKKFYEAHEHFCEYTDIEGAELAK